MLATIALIVVAVMLALHGAPAWSQSERRIGGMNPDAEAQEGKVAVYSPGLAGRLTASGARYNPKALTAAHATLPFGAQLRLTRPVNNRSVIVTINDRLDPARGRILDISQEAARRLGMKELSITDVRTELVGMTRVVKDQPKKARNTPSKTQKPKTKR